MADPDSVEEWLILARQHEQAARAIVEDKIAAAQGHFHAGIAVECTLKAFIMRKERLNSWPSKAARPDLYTHDLRELRSIAGIVVSALDENAAPWHVVTQWDRNQGYDPKPMPRKVARSLVDAAFGPKGVVTWLRANLK